MTRGLRLPRRAVIGVAAAIAAAAALILGGVLATRMQSDIAAEGPLSDDTVVARLQTGRTTSPELRKALHAARAAPEDAGEAKRAARVLIDAGRAAGESRLVGASLGLLRPFLE